MKCHLRNLLSYFLALPLGNKSSNQGCLLWQLHYTRNCHKKKHIRRLQITGKKRNKEEREISSQKIFVWSFSQGLVAICIWSCIINLHHSQDRVRHLWKTRRFTALRVQTSNIRMYILGTYRFSNCTAYVNSYQN